MLKKKKLALVRHYYPHAITTIDAVNRVIDLVEDQLELDPSRVMIADSICGDDVNSIQYPIRSQEFMGPFKMGGLDGFPFAGLTAMQAFASHVPKDGAVYLYYGPHIGISKEGKMGEIQRTGLLEPSPCCGALKNALDKLKNNTIVADRITDIDYQMNTIEQILYREKQTIMTSENPLYEATEIIYRAIDQRMMELIQQTTFSCRYLLVMGTILINGDKGMGSFASTKRFDVIDIEQKTSKNYLPLFLLEDN